AARPLRSPAAPRTRRRRRRVAPGRTRTPVKQPGRGTPRPWAAASGTPSSRRRLLGGGGDGRAPRCLAWYDRDLDVLALKPGLDLADAVAHGCRALEVQGLGGRPHLVLEQGELLPQVVERELALPRVELRRRALGLGLR